MAGADYWLAKVLMFFFWIEENIVLPDMVKSSYNGVFLDLNTVIEGLADMPLNQTVLKAGEVDGKQYFLPLGYMLPGIAVTGEMLGRLDTVI